MTNEIEPHAFGIFVPEKAEVLIIGTFPSHQRNRDFEFFYPNKNNAFWKIMEIVYGYTFQQKNGIPAVAERKQFVAERKIALIDMLAKAIRQNNSSGDNQIVPTELTDAISILEKHHTIKRILLTSRSGETSGLSLFKCHLLANKIPFFYNYVEKIGKGYFEYSGRRIDVFVPYSPSPRVVRRFGMNALAEMYKVSLFG